MSISKLKAIIKDIKEFPTSGDYPFNWDLTYFGYYKDDNYDEWIWHEDKLERASEETLIKLRDSMLDNKKEYDEKVQIS